jgi:predicted negative regulator of RcsB-dependent stress response
MSFDQVTHSLKSTVLSWWDALLDREDNFKYSKQVGIAFGFSILALFSFFGHRWYVGYRERAAQKQLGYYLAEFAQAKQADTPFAWQQAGSLFRVGYDQNKSSYLAPYFLFYQASALFNAGNQQEAITILDDAIKNLSGSPFLNMYKTKRALMLLDMNDVVSQERGLKELEAIAHDATNLQADLAQFYLGRYYWTHDRVDDAKKIWTELVESQKAEKIAASPWAAQAASLLDSIAG